MGDFRFKLERGGGKHACPACKQRRFVRYFDTETGEQVADEVGRCDREDSCGYHLTPSEYFQMTGEHPFSAPRVKRKPIKRPEPEPSFIPDEVMRASFAVYNQNNFCRWICSVFGEPKALDLALAYRLGTSRHWSGATVFWQVDVNGRVRAGKIMLYNEKTGKREREPYNHIQWVHKVLKIEPYHLMQCLFGEHLLNEDTSKPIAVVESEKTAIIGAGFMPEMLWVATAGKGNINAGKLDVLRGRDVTLFPDLGAFEKWQEIGRQAAGVKVSDVLERRASAEDRAAGLDIADFLLREHFAGRRAAV